MNLSMNDTGASVVVADSGDSGVCVRENTTVFSVGLSYKESHMTSVFTANVCVLHSQSYSSR